MDACTYVIVQSILTIHTMAYKNKYLIFREKPYNLGKTVAQINVSHLTKPQAKKLWRELDGKYSPDVYHSSLTETNDTLIEF